MSNTRWGCPWHGLVENGNLQTPAGPIAIGHTSHSDTHLIDFGMPAVDTPAEHQAKGMAWLNKAIISGGRLHGTELPEGSWIWRDDNDENWLVEVENTYFGKADGQPVEVVLTRFGVIGATVRETYTYSVNMPSAGADYAAHYGGSLRSMALKMRDVSPRGNAAVFGVRLPFQGWYASWAELTLSGTGGSCTLSLGMVRTAAITAGVLADADLAPAGFWYGAFITHSVKTSTGSMPEIPDCTGQLVETWNGEPVHYAAGEPWPSKSSYIYSANVWSLDAEKSRRGVIVGMIYSDTGDLVELSADFVVSVVGESPTPAEQWEDAVVTTTGHGMSGNACIPDVSTSYGWVKVSLNAQATLEAKVSLRVGDQLAHEVTQVVTLSHTAAVEHTNGGPYPIQTVADTETTWSSGGRSKTSRRSNDGSTVLNISMFSDSFGAIIFPENAVAEPSISFIVPTDTDDFAVMRMSVVRYSNNVIGIHKELTGNQSSPYEPPGSVSLEYDTGNAVATPLGQRTVAEEKGAGPSPYLHASFNPITGQVARSNNRVNWI